MHPENQPRMGFDMGPEDLGKVIAFYTVAIGIAAFGAGFLVKWLFF